MQGITITKYSERLTIRAREIGASVHLALVMVVPAIVGSAVFLVAVLLDGSHLHGILMAGAILAMFVWFAYSAIDHNDVTYVFDRDRDVVARNNRPQCRMSDIEGLTIDRFERDFGSDFYIVLRVGSGTVPLKSLRSPYDDDIPATPTDYEKVLRFAEEISAWTGRPILDSAL